MSMINDLRKAQAAQEQAAQRLADLRTAFNDSLTHQIGLAYTTAGLLEAIKRRDQHLNSNSLAADVWACREELAPLAAAYGVRIIEHAEYKNHAELENI